MNNFSFNEFNETPEQQQPRQRLDEQTLAELNLAAFYGYLSPHEYAFKLAALKAGQPIRYVRPELSNLYGDPIGAEIIVVEKEIFFKIKKPFGLELISATLNKEFLLKSGYVVMPNFSMIQGDI